MKNPVKIASLILILVMSSFVNTYAQGRGGGRGYHRGGARVGVRNNNGWRRNNEFIVRSPYRPGRIGVYYPVWRPAYAYHRRWVYFPRYNFYWDNWRQGYYYRSGPVWMFNTSPPPAVININIQNEKNYELKEKDDDVDDVYKTNNTHKTEFAADTLK